MTDIKSIENFQPATLFADLKPQRHHNPYVDIGEFLPKLKKGMVEIASIELASVTGDIINICACHKKEGIQILVEDEYLSKFIGYKNHFTKIPNQGEIFNIIVEMGYEDNDGCPSCLFGLIEDNDLDNINDIKDFFQIYSDFYPNLDELFENYLRLNDYE